MYWKSVQRSSRDVLPELACGEALAHHHGAATDQRRARGHYATDAVVHRQAVVHAVGGGDIHHPREPVAPLQQPVVADDGGLGQARGARGIDVKRAIAECGRSPLVFAYGLRGHALDQTIDSRQQ